MATTGNRRPVLVNNEGKMLCFSSAEAQDAYVEAFADWERPGFDTEAKSRGMPGPLRWAYRAGLTGAGCDPAPVSHMLGIDGRSY